MGKPKGAPESEPPASTPAPPDKAPAPKLDLRVAVDLQSIRLNVVDDHHKGSLDAVFTQLGAEDKVLAVRPLTYKLDFNPEDYKAVLERGDELYAPLTLHASARALRVVIRDPASGLIGSVTVPLEKFLPATAAN